MNWKYLRYVLRHKWFVFIAGRKTGATIWRLLKHDWSKFLPCEWFPYVNYFYGEYKRAYGPDVRPNEEANQAWWKQQQLEAFNRSWLHHQHANDHHWQHWVLREDSGETFALEMPEACWREMVADWCGAGRAITGKWEAYSWFKANEHRMVLHPKTANNVLQMLASLSFKESK